MGKIYSAIPYYYGASPDSPNSTRLIIELEDEADTEILRHAVDQAMERYPYFRVRLAEQDAEIILEDNPAEVVVRTGSAPVTLGSAEANGHLIGFTCEGNRIYVDYFHGLADVAGINPLIATLMYFYCRERYDPALDPAGIRLPGEELPQEEIEDPYPTEMETVPKPSYRAGRKAALKLSPFNAEEGAEPTMYNLRIRENELLHYAREHDGSPAVVLALLISRAVDALHPDAELPVICGMAANIRGSLGKPLAHHSTVTQLFLEYKDAMKKMNTTRQLTCLRGMVMVQLQSENIRFVVSLNQGLFKKWGCVRTSKASGR